MQPLIITGRAGSGKDTLANALIEELSLKKSVPFTTRPIRDNEIQGHDYVFLSQEEFDKTPMFEKREYDVVNGGVYKYGSNLPEENEVQVRDVQALDLTEKGYTVILVQVPEQERIRRLKARSDYKEGSIELRTVNESQILQTRAHKATMVVSGSGDLKLTVAKIKEAFGDKYIVTKAKGEKHEV